MIREKKLTATKVDLKDNHENKLDVPRDNQRNQLLSLAMPILALLVSVRSIDSYNSLEQLKENVIKLLNYFEAQSKQVGYTHRIILASRYCLCTALDEAVLGTSWGRESIWAEQSLLATLHHETWGGERFYIILEKMGDEGVVNLDLLELIYLILSIGFEGMYYNNEAKREEIRQHLYEKICAFKPHTPKTLYLNDISARLKNASKRYAWKMWTTLILSLGIILATGLFYQYRLDLLVNHMISDIAIFKMKSFTQYPVSNALK